MSSPVTSRSPSRSWETEAQSGEAACSGSHRVLPDRSPPRGRGGGGWTLGTRGPGVQARGEHLGTCCHLVAPRGGAAGFPPASEPSPYGDHRALGDPGKPPGAGIPSRARLPGPGRAGANGRDGEASMVRKEMGARPRCPVLTMSRPLPPCLWPLQTFPSHSHPNLTTLRPR